MESAEGVKEAVVLHLLKIPRKEILAPPRDSLGKRIPRGIVSGDEVGEATVFREALYAVIELSEIAGAKIIEVSSSISGCLLSPQLFE